MNARRLSGGSAEIDAFASMNNGATPDGRVIVRLYTEMDTNSGRGDGLSRRCRRALA